MPLLLNYLLSIQVETTQKQPGRMGRASTSKFIHHGSATKADYPIEKRLSSTRDRSTAQCATIVLLVSISTCSLRSQAPRTRRRWNRGTVNSWHLKLASLRSELASRKASIRALLTRYAFYHSIECSKYSVVRFQMNSADRVMNQLKRGCGSLSGSTSSGSPTTRHSPRVVKRFCKNSADLLDSLRLSYFYGAGPLVCSFINSGKSQCRVAV